MPESDTLHAIVLVHGACRHSGCWTPTVAALAERAPDIRVVAVDLPGHGRSSVALAGVTVAGCVDKDRASIEAGSPSTMWCWSATH